jgi:NAD(P)H-dependent FMN reductase
VSRLKIAVILGSTRPGRNGEAVADWVMNQAKTRTEAEYELIDLADYPLPHMDEPIPPSQGRYAGEHTKEWAAKIAQYDGYVFITPEYNRSIPGVLKNAIDYVYAEWNNKAAALVGYGTVGGIRAVEQLRQVLTAVKIAHVHQALAFSLFTDFEDLSRFTPAAHHEPLAAVMFDQLESWSRAMATERG